MVEENISVNILGAGLVGSLLALQLYQLGCKVELFERRSNPKTHPPVRGRSINLALSDRGIMALKALGMDKKVLERSVAMRGRMIHKSSGELVFQPYHHQENRCIYSVERSHLNQILLDEAEKQGIKIHFEHSCYKIDFQHQELILKHQENTYNYPYNFLFGTDGAFSILRKSMEEISHFSYQQQYLDYGYKELHISPEKGKSLEKNALHIWPRQDFMLIALPNIDGSFTCTLFLKLQGAISFEEIDNQDKVYLFFQTYFPDTLALIDSLETSYNESPVGKMVTIKSKPWYTDFNTCLIGDAAHAIVPFYGQGMNAGFEGVRLLAQAIKDGNNFRSSIKQFAENRSKDTDAIADLALMNFIEMRDLVDDEAFILRKKIEHWLSNQFPNQYQTIYEQVTFSDIPYSKALEQSKIQGLMFDEILSKIELQENWETATSKALILQIVHKYLFA